MIRRTFTLLVIITLASFGLPIPAQAAAAQAQQTLGQISGTAQSQGGQAAANVTIRVRNIDTNQIGGTTQSAADGSYSVGGLNAGNYVVEVVDTAGNVIGTTAPISLAAGQVITGVALTTTAAAAAAAAAAATAGGLASIFTTTGLLVLAGAAAAAVAGVTTTGTTASPSR